MSIIIYCSSRNAGGNKLKFGDFLYCHSREGGNLFIIIEDSGSPLRFGRNDRVILIFIPINNSRPYREISMIIEFYKHSGKRSIFDPNPDKLTGICNT